MATSMRASSYAHAYARAFREHAHACMMAWPRAYLIAILSPLTCAIAYNHTLMRARCLCCNACTRMAARASAQAIDGASVLQAALADARRLACDAGADDVAALALARALG
eukprot:6181776-Pleurochrysis_carterae.AAC.1